MIGSDPNETYEVPLVFEGKRIGTAQVGPDNKITGEIDLSEDCHYLKEVLFYGVADSLSIQPTHLQEEA